MRLAEIAIPVPLGRAFSYEIPDALAGRVAPGSRVVCEFGRRRTLGVVLEVRDGEPAFDRSKLKPIAGVVDPEPLIELELLAFLREVASYYLAPIGEVLQLALPALERTLVRDLERRGLFESRTVSGVGGRRISVARATPDASVEGEAALKGQAREILAHLRAEGEAPIASLEGRWGNARAAVKKLAALGLVTTEEREEALDPFFASSVARDVPPELTSGQAEATREIEAALASGAARSFLLHGVTGSGKTEVYLRAIGACLARRRGALVLVPEIALTPQLVGRFRARFGDDVAVLHSGLADRERHRMWKLLRDGEVHVAIGARSALFAPVKRLGLLVVDEEHDGSFKQEEGTRYHARDMAMLRAHRAGAVAVLGSATPSLETEALAQKGKVVRLVLPDRAHATAVLPKVELVDLKKFRAGPTGDALLSMPLVRAIERTLAAKEQTILFLNRRGFAPSVVCDGCGEVAECASCSVALTFHRAHGGRVRCHYCDFDGPMLAACPSCGEARLVLEGLGTEKLEDTIARTFPGARVARLDRDVASGAKAEAVLERVRSGEVDILVGTQMVTKGHDLPRVTLVGVLNADAALSVPDYRAAERGFQLLVQVAGRAGRGDRPGTVIVQTRDPKHAAITFAATHDVAGFVERELADRRELGYPPFTRLALLRVDAADDAVARSEASRLAEAARATAPVKAGEVDVLGPAPAPIARLRGRFRYRVMLRADDRKPLRAVLLPLAALRDRLDRKVRAVIDVDPVQMM